jgi:gamma-glutamyltranspeptidase
MKFIKAARPAIMGQNGMVSSGHHLASLTGVEILKEGGNAVDAALAAAFVMSVVKPETSGPGGDLFALVYMRKPARWKRSTPAARRRRKRASSTFTNAA